MMLQTVLMVGEGVVMLECSGLGRTFPACPAHGAALAGNVWRVQFLSKLNLYDRLTVVCSDRRKAPPILFRVKERKKLKL